LVWATGRQPHTFLNLFSTLSSCFRKIASLSDAIFILRLACVTAASLNPNRSPISRSLAPLYQQQIDIQVSWPGISGISEHI
jgi:hypothetical protein